MANSDKRNGVIICVQFPIFLSGKGIRILRKGLTILGILFIILIVFGEVVVPQLAESALKAQLVQMASTRDVQVSLDAEPRAMIALGHIGKVQGVLHDGRIGELKVSELTLEGENIRVDMAAALRDKRLVLESSQRLELQGIVSEDDLKELLSRQVERLENLEVRMTPEGVHATANMKVFGRMADVELSGTFLVDDGNLYFHLNSLNLRNALLRKIQLDSLFTDIRITNNKTLPAGLRFDSVELLDGKAVVRAVRPDDFK